MHDKPLLTVVAGPAGAGKSTVLAALQGSAGFPARYIVEHLIDGQQLEQVLTEAISHKLPLVIESRLDSPTVLHAMDWALERGFSVELVLVDVDAVELLAARLGPSSSTQEAKEALARYRHHLPAAVDLAKRVLLIDNSAAQPVISELRAPGASPAQLSGPRWFTEKVVAPQLQRLASREALRRAVVKGPLQPVIQAARASSQPTTGLLVEVTKHHALQQAGQALHLIHDLAMLPLGGAALVAGAVALVAYQAEVARASERDRTHGPESADSRDREERPQQRDRAR